MAVTKVILVDDHQLIRMGITALLSAEKDIQRIADQLGISHRTVDTHRTNVTQKVKVKNVAELVKYSIIN